MGTGSGISIVTDSPHSQTEICPNTSLSLQAEVNDNQYSASTTYAYAWTISQRNGLTGATTTYTESAQTIFVTTPGVGNWLDVAVRVTSSCGNFFPASQSWQSVSQFQTGGACLVQRVPPQASEPMAYPNPVDERLQLPLGSGTYVLYKSHGQAVRRQPASPTVAGVLTPKNCPLASITWCGLMGRPRSAANHSRATLSTCPNGQTRTVMLRLCSA